MRHVARNLLLVGSLVLFGCSDDSTSTADTGGDTDSDVVSDSDIGTDPVVDPVTDPVTDPVADPVTDPVTDPVADPVTDPVTDAVADADADAGGIAGCPGSVYCIDDVMVPPTIGVRSADILTIDGLEFKDSNDNGELDDYEDWRLSPNDRVADLISQMSVEQMIGLLAEGGLRLDTDLEDGSVSSGEMGDLVDQNIRQRLLRWPNGNPNWDAELLATHMNNLQELAESEPLGIPNVWTMDPIFAAANNMPATSSTGDPGSTRLQHQNSANIITDWPLMTGLAAINDVAYVEALGRMQCEQIRAVGIRWMLGPQAELASEPMWSRVYDTFGADETTAPLLAAAYIRGFQGADDHVDVYTGCVATMKHFPGGGANEGGMDSHSEVGRYNVYPGDNFAGHIAYDRTVIENSNPFALMPVYSILEDVTWGEGEDAEDLQQVGASYEPIVMVDILRNDFGWDGFVSSDWGALGGTGWGTEDWTNGQRLNRYFNVGGHQVGNGNLNQVRDAFAAGDISQAQIEVAAGKALEMAFTVGAFENPYVEPTTAEATINAYAGEAHDAMRRAFTLLKNASDILPLDTATTDQNGTAGIQIYYDGHGWCTGEPLACSGGMNEGATCAIDDDCSPVVSDYVGAVTGFSRVSDPDDADYAIIRLSARFGSYFGWDGGVPLSWTDPIYVYDQDTSGPSDTLSAAGGFGGTAVDNTAAAQRTADKLDALIAVRDTNPNLKIIVVVSMYRPFIIEPWLDDIDVLAAEFGMTDAALLDMVFQMVDGAQSTALQPTGTLPFEVPSSQEAVYNALEDVPHDSADPTYEIRSGITSY